MLIKKLIDYLIVFLIVLFITLGFIYEIKYDAIKVNLVAERNFLIGFLFVALTVRILNQPKHWALLASTLLLVISLVVNMAIERSSATDIIKPIAQILFAYVLTQYFANNGINFLQKINGLVVFLVPAVALISWGGVCIAFNDEKILFNYIDGFRGNRVNFSIFLAQLIGFLLLIGLNQKEKSQKLQEAFLIMAVLGVLASQIISGGRTGIILSTILYFIMVFKSRSHLMIKLCLFFITFFIIRTLTLSAGIPTHNGYAYTDILRVDPNVQQSFDAGIPTHNGYAYTDILRVDPNVQQSFDVKVIDEVGGEGSTYSSYIKEFLSNLDYLSSLVKNLLLILDYISSYRISIFLETLRALTINDVFFGRGAGNFQINLGSEVYEPHVVFLNQLGQFGIVYLLGVIVFLTALFRCFSKKYRFCELYCICFLLPTFLQPAFLHTQISTSVLFFMFSGIVIGSYRPCEVSIIKKLPQSKN
jgi:hypothetical protein